MQNKFVVIEADPELVELGVHCGEKDWKFDYVKATAKLNEYIKKDNDVDFYEAIQTLAEDDFFFFCYHVLDLPVSHPFLMQRCYDIQDDHKDTVDLWAREHWKSTLITKAFTIWTFIHNPSARQVIFSHTRSIAKSFLRDIKLTLEGNDLLKFCWPNVFYENPVKDAPKWSEEDGIYVKRKQTMKEASLEAWGLVDGLPTGKHYSHRIYDDPIDVKNVTTGSQMKKAIMMYDQSVHLGARGGEQRIIGTRYSTGDMYAYILKKKKMKARIYAAEVDEKGNAKYQGKPVFLTREELDDKAENLSEFNYSSQMLQDPVAKSEQKFSPEWLRYYTKRPYLNLYMTVDPAGGKSKRSDYTVMCIIGVDSMRNYFLVDMVRDKLSLGERWDKIKEKVQEWGINTTIGYEKYGMQSDMDYFEERMQADGFFCTMVELGGNVSKEDRIKRLVPLFSRGRFLLPYTLPYVDSREEYRELILEFITEEYEKFPFSAHDDMMDCMARITDSKMGVIFPQSQYGGTYETKKPYDPLSTDEEQNTSWMGI